MSKRLSISRLGEDESMTMTHNEMMSKSDCRSSVCIPACALFLLLLLSFCGDVTVNAEVYDAIVVGAGAGGCPLTQTLVEGGKKVLLLERGPERPPVTENILDAGNVLFSECVETFSSGGVQASTGKCMGGATSFNQGIWIEETPEWVKNEVEKLLPSGQSFHSLDEISQAFQWARERVAPVPTQEQDGTNEEVYVDALFQSFEAALGGDVDKAGSPIFRDDTIWRTHSTFEPATGNRRPADTVLDRSNPNLQIKTNNKVSEVVFEDTNWWESFSFLWTWLFPGLFTSDLRAKCVKLENGDNECVDPSKGGKIFLAAGTFNTPGLLLRSGIGPFGFKKFNWHVGRHLSDKPFLLRPGFFQSDFDYSGLLTVSHVVASTDFVVSGIKKTLLFEEISYGVPVAFDVLAYERNFLPYKLRELGLTDDFVELINKCKVDDIRDDDPECSFFVPFSSARCDRNGGLLAIFLSDPTSEGTVTRNWWNGRLTVNANYFATKDDRLAFDEIVGKSTDIINGVEGPSAWSRTCEERLPGASPEQLDTCKATSCPDLLTDWAVDLFLSVDAIDFVSAIVSLFPFGSDIFDGIVEWLVELFQEPTRNSIISPHHFAGTARLGNVLNRDFSVIGTENLYVADVSALPKTPRGNSMSAAMMIGRLVGTTILESWGT